MKRYGLIQIAILLLLVVAPMRVDAQSVVNMINGDTVFLDACTLGSGTIYDDGGVSNNYSDNFDGWVRIQASAGVSIRLTGNYVTEMCCDRLVVYDDTILLVNQVAGTGLIDVTATSGSMLIRFQTNDGATMSGFAFTWSTSGTSTSCTNPVTNLDTTAVTTSSISLTWNATNTAGPFTIFSNGVVAGTSSTNSFTLNELNAATLYEITVVATSSVNSRCCASTIGVRTACGVPSMPYGEGFEWFDDQSFPPCWLSSQNFDEEEFLPQVVAAQRNSGKRSLMFSCGANNTPEHFGMVATPPLAGNGIHTLRVKMLTSHSGAVVMVGTCDSVGSDYNAYGFTPIQTLYLYDNYNWEEMHITWNATSGRRLAFRMEQSQQNGEGRRVYIDDMSIEVCGVDSVRAYHIDYDRFSVSWSTYGNPTCTLGIRPEGAFTDSITINNAVSPYTFTNLGADRYYTVTIYPTCGNAGISRSTTAHTSPLPTNAATFCSDFYDRTALPGNWTYHRANNDCGYSFQKFWNSNEDNNYLNDYYSNVYQKSNYLVSERLYGLAGKQITVDYAGGFYYSANVITIGTMTYPDDTSSFVPLASDTVDGGTRRTLTATVPTSSTGSYIAIRYRASYDRVQIYGVQSGVALVDSVHLLHRRGSKVEFGWAQAYDTVLIQYGPRNFTFGSGTVDTFYHATHGTVTGLMPSTLYDFYIYRPATAPCTDFRRPVRTATQDYPLPYCENFDNPTGNEWNSYDYFYGNGDWQRINSMYEYPKFGPQPYDGNTGNSLQLASWGFNGDYYTTALLPDAEVDSNSILSFYITDNAPNSTIVVGVLPEGNYDHYSLLFQVLDTLHISAHNRRVHVNYAFRPSDTLLDHRVALRYIHPHQFSYYKCYIDELKITHATFSDYHCYATGYTTAGLSFGQLIGTDSAEVTIIGGGITIDTVLTQANIDSLNLTGLDTGTYYRCYVRPYGGCTSYAGDFYTHSDGGGVGYGNCFPFDDVLSDELPYRWSASGGTEVTNDDYLLMEPSTAVATHTLAGISDLSFSFRAKAATVGDTLLLGMIPADSIHVDSTHFNFQPSIFNCIDTIIVDTAWRYYMYRLPDTDTNRVRMTFLTLNDTISVDEVGWTWCPILHFSVDGNTILCEFDPDQSSSYFLHITDSTGEDDRVIFVEQNPYRVEGLHLGRRYDLWWQCLHGEDVCRPIVSLRTESLVPLPYCEDFNIVEGTISIPPTWDFFKADPNDELRLDMWGPSLVMHPNSNRWEYAVLPPFDADSAMSLHANFHDHWGQGRLTQVGYLANGIDTGSFVPLWSTENEWDLYPEIDFSPYTDKRIAIRTRGCLAILYVHVYAAPLAKVSLVASRQLKVTTPVASPYWLHYRDYWNNYQDTMFYVDSTVFYIHDTNITSNDRICMEQTDSAGYSCENNKQYYIGYKYGLPFCHVPDIWCCPILNWEFRYSPYGQSQCDSRQCDNHGRYGTRFEGQSSSWNILYDFDIDSIRHAGMRVTFDAGSSNDTMVVGVLEDAYDTINFIPVDTLVYTRVDDSLQVAFVDFSDYTGNGRWITFHHLWGQNARWFDIHDVFVESCPGAMGATARLSRWNRVRIDSPKTPFYVEYFHTNESCQGCGNTILRIDSVPQILILDPETTYDFYFRCDSNAYTCMPAQRVATLGAPLEVPSCTDFDTAAVGSVIHNWTIHQSGIGVTNNVAHSGANSMEMPIGIKSYLITPDINIDSIQNAALSIWYQVEDLADRLVVGVMSDPNDLATFYPIRTLAPIETGVWQHSLVDFNRAPDDAHFIALRARSNRQAGGRSIFVDDIYVSNCAAFDFSVQSLTNNSIDLTWSQVGTPNTTITVLDEGVVANVYTNPTPPLHIEPLTTLHYYTFELNSVCGETQSFCNTNYADTLSVVTPSPGVGCINATDLASPQAVFFSGTYNNPYSKAGAINYGPLHPDSRHTVCYDTAQRDPRTGGQLRTIPEGYTSSVRLGNWSTNAYNPEAEGVIYSLLVDTASFELLLLRYAAVLQDPLHATSDQPRFRMELLDTNYNIIDSACTSADFIADQSLGWHTADDGVLWKDWTAVGVDLSSHAGQQVYFRLTTFDCNEGSHYGYAYFTLECMRKNMNTVSCGDVDSNTLSAPEGFHYRWYTSQSNATVSTAQSIRVPSEDITYFCEVSKLDNAACQFLIRAYGGTRYPKASFDTSMVIDSCRFYVTFTNTGGVSNDGMTLIPGERCETTYWDFGNGTVSTGYNGSATYLTPGTYTVRLVSGVAFDACQDTAVMTLVLDLPPGMAPSDTTVMSICDNEQYTFFGEPYNTTGTFYHNVPVVGNPCDSIYVLQLDVRATSVGDTSAIVCDSIFWHGTTYTDDGVYPDSTVGPNSVLCDSTIVLTLAVHPTYDTVDTLVICPYRPYVYEGVDYGGPVTFDTILHSDFVCDSVVHVTLQSRDSNYRLASYFHFDSADWQQPDSVLTGCAPSTLYMADSTEGAEHWLWTLFAADTQFTSTERNISYIVPTGRDSVTAFVSLIVEDEVGCFDTIGWPLFVFPPPEPEFRWDPLVPSINSPEVRLLNLSTPLREEMEENHSIAYLWRIQKAEGGEFDTSSEYELRYHWGEEGDNMAGDYTVRLINYWTHYADSFYVADIPWTDSTLFPQHLYEAFYYTCADTAEHIITITNEYLQFPNLVTPNGDGVNDRWEIKNLVEFGNYSMNELWIYDRTGTLIYHVKNIRRTDQFWDPAATRSPDGTYYYRFVAEGEYGVVKRNGLIEVLRK